MHVLKKFNDLGLDHSVPVTAYISTKGRHTTTLPLAIQSIALQSTVPRYLWVFDDDQGVVPFYSSPHYVHLFNLLNRRGCEVTILRGQGRGQVANHQSALEMSTTDLVWRLDDDNVANPNVLQGLYMAIESAHNTAAVASLVHYPWATAEEADVRSSGAISDVKCKDNIQWYSFSGQKNVQHLHNTFLYRKSAAKPYPTNLSCVGHREETMFTGQMWVDGWTLTVCGDLVTWHLREDSGGIRSFSDNTLWILDENAFDQWASCNGIKFHNYWFVILDNGRGDHWAFKHVLPNVVDKAKAEGKTLVLALSYPDVFFDVPSLAIISIADAKKIVGHRFDSYNVYNYMDHVSWKGCLVDAYRSHLGL